MFEVRLPRGCISRLCYLALGARQAHRNAYRRYVEEAIRSGLAQSPWEEVKAGFVVGGAEFLKGVRKRIRGDAKEQPGLEAIKRSLGIKEFAKTVSGYKREDWKRFVNRRGDWGRDMVLLFARKNTMMTNRELAEHIGRVDDSAVTQAVRRLEKRIQSDPRLFRAFEMLQKRLPITENSKPSTTSAPSRIAASSAVTFSILPTAATTPRNRSSVWPTGVAIRRT